MQGDLLDEFPVVAGNAQLPGHRLADGPPAAAEFPADGQNAMFHTDSSFWPNSLYVCRMSTSAMRKVSRSDTGME